MAEAAALPFSMVIAGASGDLAVRKLLPAVYSLYRRGRLPRTLRILGLGRTPLNDAAFRERIAAHLPEAGEGSGTPARREAFLQACGYVRGDYDSRETLRTVDRRLRERESSHAGRRIYYLAVPPFVFPSVVDALGSAGLLDSACVEGWPRLVAEKPFGRDRSSSDELNRVMLRYLEEAQIYRIDHYLGKHIVQELMVLRFANRVFAPVWHRDHIAEVRIDWRETGGVGQRGGYFDRYGIIRDVFQNHMLQILALVAMEPPERVDDDGLHRAKVDLLRRVAPATLSHTVAAQYTAGGWDGSTAPAYVEEEGIAADSRTPTYAATRLTIDHPRWRGVPFVLSGGKAMNRRLSEVTVRLRHPDRQVFPDAEGQALRPNRLVMQIQPEASIRLFITNKRPGIEMALDQSSLDLCYTGDLAREIPGAYEAMLQDVVAGRRTLFVRSDELAAAWDVFTPLLQAWEQTDVAPGTYAAGTAGPSWPQTLLQSVGR